MRLLRLFLLNGLAFVVLLGALASPAGAVSRGLQVTIKQSERAGAPDAGTVNLYGASHALVIGINNYPKGWPRLSNAVRDAELIAVALQKRGFEVSLHINLKSDELKATVEEFYVDKGADPAARLFVWFAGHGHTLEYEGFLVPADAPDPDRSAAATRFRLKDLSLRRFGEFVCLAQSKHAYTVFDACFADTVFNSQRSKPPPASRSPPPARCASSSHPAMEARRSPTTALFANCSCAPPIAAASRTNAGQQCRLLCLPADSAALSRLIMSEIKEE